jgi:hypothetical protein
VVEGGFAPGDPVTHWNLKDWLAALGSNRIGPDLRWSRLAPRSCWPGLPSEFETNFANALGVAQYLWQGLSVLEPCLLLARNGPTGPVRWCPLIGVDRSAPGDRQGVDGASPSR